LWDTAGQEDFDRLRPLSYPDSDIVCICFSLVDRRSFLNVKEKWHPEVKHYLADVPTFLCGTKADLRDSGAADQISGKVEPVTRAEGEAAAKDLACASYFEVSAKARTNVDELFNAAIDVVLKHRKGGKGGAGGAGGNGKKKKCTLL
jgi:small GTP-binding protein